MKSNRFMILGDSYSTFEGYIPEGYKHYYGPIPRPDIDVTRVEETWWHPLCEELSLNLVRNDSWSGAPIAYPGWEDTDCSMSSSFIYRPTSGIMRMMISATMLAVIRSY